MHLLFPYYSYYFEIQKGCNFLTIFNVIEMSEEYILKTDDQNNRLLINFLNLKHRVISVWSVILVLFELMFCNEYSNCIDNLNLRRIFFSCADSPKHHKQFLSIYVVIEIVE